MALVPGYINYLWQEIRMTLRLASLYGRDPGELRTAAEVLSLPCFPELTDAEIETTARAIRDALGRLH